MKAYLDTNVFLDLLVKDRPNSISSLIVFESIVHSGDEIFISTQSIIDSYYIADRQDVNKEEIDNWVAWLLSYANVTKIGWFEFQDALKSGERDIEDAAQVALAKAENCDVFITADAEILAREKDDFLLFISPKEFIRQSTEVPATS